MKKLKIKRESFVISKRVVPKLPRKRKKILHKLVLENIIRKNDGVSVSLRPRKEQLRAIRWFWWTRKRDWRDQLIDSRYDQGLEAILRQCDREFLDRAKAAISGAPFKAPDDEVVLDVCPHCGHSLVDNSHGFDQNDGDIDEAGDFVHSGRCTYCKEC